MTDDSQWDASSSIREPGVVKDILRAAFDDFLRFAHRL